LKLDKQVAQSDTLAASGYSNMEKCTLQEKNGFVATFSGFEFCLYNE
jgi:hypothetical protein